MKLFGVIISFLLMASSTFANAGSESSVGGADDYRVISAFFRANDASIPITACLDIAPGFGIDASTLSGMITQAFNQWSNYVVQKRLNILPGRFLINTHLALGGSCNGSENLRVLFGVSSLEVDRYKSQFSKPFGFAQLLDDGGGFPAMGHGIIWVAPPGGVDSALHIPMWSGATEVLAALILHEMGHVFGCGHVDGTVMTEKIGQYLETDSAGPDAFSGMRTIKYLSLYSSIDAQIELVPCLECQSAYQGVDTIDPIHVPGTPIVTDWAQAFQTLVGRIPTGAPSVTFERVGSPTGSGRLILTDTLGSSPFTLTAETQIGQRRDSTPLFSGTGGINFFSFGVSYYAQIKTNDGASLPVALNYNMDGKKVEILPLGSGFFPRPIFVSGQ